MSGAFQGKPFRAWRALALAAAGLAGIGALVVWLNLRGDAHEPGTESRVPVTPQLIERGAALARAGNCAGCHTPRGGAAYAGGVGIATPFGTVYAGNLTPDVDTGIGAWTAGDFWRALHNGRSRDGRLLTPAFPYTSFTQVTRDDADAIYAYLRSLPAVAQANRPHELRFPYNQPAALAVWRALYFRPGVFTPQADQSAEWNRGAYLVRGLGHCEACHAPRNALGATRDAAALGGGAIPQQNWYAPSLSSPREAGVADWPVEDIVALLQTGRSPHGAVLGPMASVVFNSTQHLDPADLRAMAVYLKALPPTGGAEPKPEPKPEPPAPVVMERGATIYKDHCAACHGAEGQGAANAYPPLAGNRKIMMTPPTNVVRVIVDGGYAPATQGNPRPYGMPPYGHSLSNTDIADVTSFIRNAWGNRADPVSELEVIRTR